MIIKLFESYTTDLNDVRDKILLKAIETDNIDIVDFFVNKGYDINNSEVISLALYNFEILKYLLNKGINFENNVNVNDYYDNKQLKTLDVQKILIDFGYEHFIHDNIGFNTDLKNDKKYSDVVKRAEDVEKYNL